MRVNSPLQRHAVRLRGHLRRNLPRPPRCHPEARHRINRVRAIVRRAEGSNCVHREARARQRHLNLVLDPDRAPASSPGLETRGYNGTLSACADIPAATFLAHPRCHPEARHRINRVRA